MSRAIVLSIRPKWVAKILNGEKTIEIRKTMPKCDLPIDVYIYCTKGKPGAILTDKGCVLANKLPVGGNSIYKSGYSLDGQVVAKFTLRKVEVIDDDYTQGETMYDWTEGLRTETIKDFELLKKSCLTKDELYDYLDYYTKKTHYGYAYHIEDLVIFDEPKELSEFRSHNKYEAFINTQRVYRVYKPLTKAPQNYCFVEV